ncbi:accessory Sec system glycosylation chaperone GtfB [Streptococcus hyovaginalis]
MILLVDHYHQKSQDLHYSLKQVGFQGECVSLSENGFLPKGVESPYGYFCQMISDEGHSLYFNQLEVPDFWEITGTNSQGEVWEYQDKKATIHYSQSGPARRIQSVDWLDKQEKPLLTEHYNQYGWLYSRTFYDDEGHPTIRTYQNKSGLEVMTENLQTGDLLLEWKGQIHVFTTRLDFYRFYLDERQFDLSNICYNSLSQPFFLSYYMNQPGQDILFWQESISDDLPGNMKALLANNHTRTQHIVFQDLQAYQTAQSLVAADQLKKMSYLGYLYPEKSDKVTQKTILIMTNSDQINQLDFLSRKLPDYQFHIGAYTEMSQHLMAKAELDNVFLYPNISAKQLEELISTCGFYFDINGGSQVDQIVRRAFEQNLLLFAFEETVHDRYFIPKSHLFLSSDPDKLIETIREVEKDFPRAIVNQRAQTSQDSSEHYHKLLKGVLNG